MYDIKITQVVNAGVLIETANKKVLIDGIHNVKTAEWSSIDDILINQIIYEDGLFHDINYLLFTHQHSDHFGKEKTFLYIEKNKVEKLIIPELDEKELKNKNALIELTTDYFNVSSIQLDNINIKYVKTKHLEEKKYGISHYSFIISTQDKNILYLGDADYSKAELINPLQNYKIDVVIAPFIIINKEIGRRFLKYVNPSILIVNHLPNSDDDKYNMRSIVEKDIIKYAGIIPETIIFQNLNDSYTLKIS